MDTDKDKIAKNLAKEMGIEEATAADLVRLLGTDRSSLIREARVVPREKDRAAASVKRPPTDQ
jgi:hypothetical protein